MRIVTLLAATASAVMLSLSASQAQDIIEAASANPELSTFVQAVEAAGLTEALKGEGPFTVFAPNNAAFEALGNGVAERLMGNQEQLAEILGMHVLTGEFMSADLQGSNARYEGINGDRIQVNAMGRANNGNGAIAIDGNEVVTPDIDADNGVIHIIEGVVH